MSEENILGLDLIENAKMIRELYKLYIDICLDMKILTAKINFIEKHLEATRFKTPENDKLLREIYENIKD